MKAPEDVKRCREISAWKKELGIAEETMANIDAWIDEQERLYDEFLKTVNPIDGSDFIKAKWKKLGFGWRLDFRVSHFTKGGKEVIDEDKV